MKVLLVDDHLMIIEALAQLLSRRYPKFRVHTATSKDEALAFLKANSDCRMVVSDLSFHGKMEGYSLVNEISEKFPSVSAIVLSMHSEQAFVRKAMAEGARGYILKTESPEEIGLAIEKAAGGETYLSPSLRSANEGRNASAHHDLSARELEIARLVRSGASSKVIGEKLDISPRTVEVHRRNIMKKLQVSNTAQLVAALEK